MTQGPRHLPPASAAPVGTRRRWLRRRVPTGAADAGGRCRGPCVIARRHRRGTVVRRGEIWWAEVPEAGRRPLLVMTRDAAIPVLNSVLVAPVTRTIRGIPTELALSPDDG